MPLHYRKTRQSNIDGYSDILLNERYSPPLKRKNDRKKRSLLGRKLNLDLSSLLLFPHQIRRSPLSQCYESLMILLGSIIILVNFIRQETVLKTGKIILLEDVEVRTSVRTRPEFNDDLKLKLNTPRGISTFNKAPKPTINSPNPNYGGLKINFLADIPDEKRLPLKRKIYYDKDEGMSGHVYNEEDFERGWRNFDLYYAFDDDTMRTKPFGKGRNCRRNSWHRLYNPSCNTMHEIEVVSLERSSNRLLGEGSYRSAFFIESIYDPELVMKCQRFDDNHYAMDRYEFVRMDALIMERLTVSQRIVDIYGHCGVSVLTEYLPKELEGTAVPYDSRRRQIKLLDDMKKNDNKIVPINDLDSLSKLEISLQMAEAIADLHGFKDGVLVHDDIQLPQFLFTGENKIKLNDFNRGEAMLYDEEKQSYCRYRNGPGGGDWRAPEEYLDEALNEKIDVWSFGNNVYSLLTGMWVYYWEEDYKKIKEIIIKGEKTPIHPEFRSRGFIENKLADIIEKCWTIKPNERPSIFEVVHELKVVKDQWLKLASKDNL